MFIHVMHHVNEVKSNNSLLYSSQFVIVHVQSITESLKIKENPRQLFKANISP